MPPVKANAATKFLTIEATSYSKFADMVELVDTLGLGPRGLCLAGSSPAVRNPSGEAVRWVTR